MGGEDQTLSITKYWKNRQSGIDGVWCHEDDREVLREKHHSLNLDHPVSPYIGDIEHASVVMLMANGGYGPQTYKEFSDIPSYLNRIDNAGAADWTGISNYYEKEKYWPLIHSGKLAILNVCAYRSPMLSEEPENQRMISIIPSCLFARKWMVKTLVPAAERGDRLIVAKRCGQWGVRPEFWNRPGIARGPMQRGSNITKEPMAKLDEFLRSRF